MPVVGPVDGERLEVLTLVHDAGAGLHGGGVPGPNGLREPGRPEGLEGEVLGGRGRVAVDDVDLVGRRLRRLQLRRDLGRRFLAVEPRETLGELGFGQWGCVVVGIHAQEERAGRVVIPGESLEVVAGRPEVRDQGPGLVVDPHI